MGDTAQPSAMRTADRGRKATGEPSPVVLLCKEMWNDLLTKLRQGSIVIKECKYLTLGVCIIPNNIEE